MLIRAISQMEVQRYELTVPHVVISIRNPWDEAVPLPDNPSRLGVLRLAFHDAESDEDSLAKFIRRNGVELTLFDRGMAAEVARFLGEHAGAEAVIVNCEMGISRSSGLAGAIAKAKNGDDSKFTAKDNPYGYDHNKLVYALALEALACS